MARNKKFVILILLVFLLSACQPPEKIGFEDVCQVAQDDKVVIVDGYFSLGTSVYCSDVSGELRCGLILNSFPDGELDFSAEVMQGRRRNQMQPLESGYLEEDLQIKTADGSIIGVGEHVRVTGELFVNEDDCLMVVDKIETIEE
jgi:hypothetical protein